MKVRHSGKLVIWGLAGALAIAMYPIAIDPMINPDSRAKYRLSNAIAKDWLAVTRLAEQSQKEMRKFIRERDGKTREDIQPGGSAPKRHLSSLIIALKACAFGRARGRPRRSSNCVCLWWSNATTNNTRLAITACESSRRRRRG